MSNHQFQPGRDLIGLVLVVLIEALFLHLAARMLTTNPRYLQAILVAVLGGILAGIVVVLVPNALLALLLAVLAWMAACATIYNIGLFRSLLLGLLAGVLFLLARWLVVVIAAAISSPKPA